VRFGPPGKLVDVQRAARQVIGDFEFGSNGQRAASP
jgi:hypothetical protein